LNEYPTGEIRWRLCDAVWNYVAQLIEENRWIIAREYLKKHLGVF
jgi:hypothetical protein